MQDAAILLVRQGARVEARGALSDDLQSLATGDAMACAPVIHVNSPPVSGRRACATKRKQRLST